MSLSRAKRIRFTRAELVEVWRALDLISQEDYHASVNMDPEAVKAKASAFEKVRVLLGRAGRSRKGKL